MENEIPVPESMNVSAEDLDHIKSAIMRVLDEFEDVSWFLSLKKFFIQLFVKPKKMTFNLRRLISNPGPPRECSEITVYAALLSHMSRDEKLRHVAPLVDMFECLMARRHRGRLNGLCTCYLEGEDCVTRLVPLCVKRFRETERASGELVQLVANLLEQIPKLMLSTISDILELLLLGLYTYPDYEDYMDWKDVDFLLTCFSDERFHAYDIRKRGTLMTSTLLKDVDMLSVVLIRHGFKYSFYGEYFAFCCDKVKEMGAAYDRPLMQAFQNSGNLRKQMAVEILVLLHVEDEKPELLCKLWLSRPDPFITPNELYHLMKLFIRTSILIGACTRYPDLIPGVPKVKQSRSLKHLARVRIRESMVKAHSIGEKAIRSLGLPKTLEDYLWKLEHF